MINPQDDLIVTTENQDTLIRIIDKYTDTTDLNKDKEKTSAILEFKGRLTYFRLHKIDLQLWGD